jgi:hypothetical protein
MNSTANKFGLAACARGAALCAAAVQAAVLARPVLAQADASSSAAPAAATAERSRDLTMARAKWRSAALSSYEYGYRKFCECHPDTPPETIVTVRGGQVVGVRHRPVDYAQEVLGDPARFKFYWTVDDLFDLVAAGFARGATVRVSYDSKLGFPTAIFVDYDSQFIGDEVDLKLTSVNPIAAR